MVDGKADFKFADEWSLTSTFVYSRRDFADRPPPSANNVRGRPPTLLSPLLSKLDPESFGNLRPALVFLAFEASQIRCRYRQAAVVEEPANVLNRLTSVTP